MNIIADTHILLWALGDDARLSEEAKKHILNKENTIYYSIASVWEVAIKHINKPKQMLLSDEEFVKGCKKARYMPMEIKEKHIALLKTLERKGENIPEHHDPFDRLILAQAKCEDLIFMTHDSQIKYYGEPCVMMV